MTPTVTISATSVKRDVTVLAADRLLPTWQHISMDHYLRRWREFQGLTQEALGTAVGTSKTQISRLESGSRRLTSVWMRRLAPILHCEPGDLLKEPPGAAPSDEKRPVSEVNFRAAKPLPPADDDLPVWGKVRGGWVAEAVDLSVAAGRTERPRALADVAEAAGAYVPGESMVPRYEAGELVIWHPGRPVTKGCYVLIAFDDDTAVIKRFFSQDDNKIVVEELNPPRRITYPRSKIRNVFRIIRGGEE